MNCHACGAQLAGTARFCHKCGAQVGGAPPQAAGWRGGLPWGVAGIAVGALLTVLVLRLGAGSREPGAGAPASAPAPGSLLPAPDISQMSPEERATRLYNRVVSLHSQGKPDSAEFFLPMALQAYAMLPALDVDARYHIGVLDLTGGHAAAALAQADTIRRAVPDRKSTRLNSSHLVISYAVFCLKKKKKRRKHSDIGTFILGFPASTRMHVVGSHCTLLTLAPRRQH